MDEIERRGAGDGATRKQMNADEEAARRGAGSGDGTTGSCDGATKEKAVKSASVRGKR